MVFVLDFVWRACPRFREDDVVGLWIPAFAGMTVEKAGMTEEKAGMTWD